MNILFSNSIRFVLLILTQAMILNNLEIGFGIYVMIYPLFIMMLPYQMKPVPLMLLAFLCGFFLDSLSNTYGLHASSAVMMAFFRPYIFRRFSPCDGYDNIENINIYSMGRGWFTLVYGSLLLIHHSWFFSIESFKWNEFGWIILKIAFSVPLSFLLSILLQAIFMFNTKNNATR